MTEKLKVSREVADAIDSFRSEFGDETLLWRHAQGWEDHEPLCRLHMVDLATALIVGYEVEMTPHEEIAVIYKHHYPKSKVVSGSTEKYFSKGYVKGIKFTLEKLGITIEGVNDDAN